MYTNGKKTLIVIWRLKPLMVLLGTYWALSIEIRLYDEKSSRGQIIQTTRFKENKKGQIGRFPLESRSFSVDI